MKDVLRVSSQTDIFIRSIRNMFPDSSLVSRSLTQSGLNNVLTPRGLAQESQFHVTTCKGLRK